MRIFSFRPALTYRGRESHGLRGFAGKPFHPPLTDIPIAAYIFAAVFDVISRIAAPYEWSRDFYRAATFVLIGGAAVSVLTALTGYLDWRTTESGTQARRTVNAHAWTMIAVTLLVGANIALRVFALADEPYSRLILVALSILAAVLVSLGAAIGGSLVFDYGFSVETSGDHAVWHESESDVEPDGSVTEEPEEPPQIRRAV